MRRRGRSCEPVYDRDGNPIGRAMAFGPLTEEDRAAIQAFADSLRIVQPATEEQEPEP